MYRTLLDQLKQVSGSRTYDDTKTMANAESLVDNRLEGDLNYLRTQLRLITGETNWYDAPDITAVDVNTALNNAFTYTGMVDKDDSTPDYPNNNFVVDNASLTEAIGVLDDVLNAVSSSSVSQDLDSVCEVGSVTDQDITVDYVTASSSGSQLPTLRVDGNLQVGNNIIVGGTVDGVDLSVWNTAIKTFTGQDADDDSTPTYSSTNYVANDDSLETAIGKLDAGIHETDVEKEVERLETQVNSGSAHTIPNSKEYTLGYGQYMDVYFNGQLLQAHLANEERDYLELATTAVKFAFDVPIGSYLVYLIRK